MAYVGLDKKFMLKAHLLVPEGYENTLYSWILNFQTVNEEYTKMYHDSLVLDEGDIYIYSDPDMYTDRFPEGLALFDQAHNCAMICGMRYFGEHKKGTLTLAWSIAERNGYTACHGGQKRFNFKDGSSTVIGVFGLSGSGKSTLVNDILYNAISNKLYKTKVDIGQHDYIDGLDEIDRVINIDQAPIGRTPRSNPATYTGVFDPIRDLFATTIEAKKRG